jgi:NADH-quinone oxidoreductase subunit I
MKRREEMTFLERIYLVEAVKGLFITFGRLVRNFTLHVLQLFGLFKNAKASASIQYPNDRRVYPERYRGRHRLTLYPACEHEDPNVEKFPKRYEIDTLLCIYCGYCVEACPVDAIRMDTGIHPEVYSADPRSFIEDKEVLMQRSRDLEDKGIDQMFGDHMQKIQKLEKKTSLRIV